MFTIPSVKGLTLAQATNELESTKYGLNPHTAFLQTAPPGTLPTPNVVLSQVPAAGTKGHQGDTVTIYVLSPTANFSVPKLAGDTTNQAAGVLGQSGLTLGPTTTKACSDTIGIGLVVGSNPAEGAFVQSGDQVSLITSTGYCKVQVPSVIGESQSQATTTLDAVPLQVNVSPTDPSTCTPAQVNTVTNESLAIGSFVPYKSQITISVCDASTETTTTVPVTTTTS